MPQCEMCGAEKASLTTTKVEGAELELCSDCSDFGTEVRTESSSSAATKYSTSSSSSSSSDSSSSSSSSSSSRRRDMFDDMETVAGDYDDRIRQAREAASLSQEDLANDINEKASVIRKLERGDILPSDDVQQKLEKKLGISLVEGESVDDADWEASSSGSMTLGDVVKRNDN
ncbi:multiprotein bridging factor aMBF1 [Halobaculum gomorrense]|uniref:Transcriptional regulator, XRE family n=1 Tax=Halobaculum gomorrense TaxID=43928 RepID=A0A1M5R0D1_9EURY|nr:multiprotein bridging factor aMBF1 [Halobaculum gomorrense]SHH19854.1 transcriptional regulator, XRE family [Halobaculum gomorrense]